MLHHSYGQYNISDWTDIIVPSENGLTGTEAIYNYALCIVVDGFLLCYTVIKYKEQKPKDKENVLYDV